MTGPTQREIEELTQLVERAEEHARRERQYVQAGRHERQESLESPCVGCGETPQTCTCTSLSAADREELNQIIDEERNEYWSKHCPAHGVVLESDGDCAVCRQEWEEEQEEERRRDL